MNLVKVVLPKASKVAVLEDSEMRQEWFKKRLPGVAILPTVQDFKDFFASHPACDFIFLDHDLGTKETGLDAAQYMHDTFGRGGKFTLIHSWNRKGAERMLDLLHGAIYIPFGDFEVEVEQ